MDDSSSGAIKGFLQLGFFIGGTGFVMLFFQPPNTPEFVLSLCSTMMGIFLVGGSIALLRWINRNAKG